MAVVALGSLVWSPSAQAYSPNNTHRWITRQAVELLVASYPGEYDELLEHIDSVVEGSFHEDDIFLDGDTDPTTLRVMRHFYHAPDGTGLTYGNKGQFPSSFEWNGTDNEQNEWDFYDGLRAYQAGDLDEAYFIIGHTAHLIQDLTVPAHSHLDQHGSLEGDSYEQYCASRSFSPTESSLATVAPGTPIPDFSTLEEAFRRTAEVSYYRNLFPGHLGEDEAWGVIADMFPDIKQSFLDSTWQIPGVGKLGKAFFEREPDYYYFKKNAAPAQVDVIDFDARNPREKAYGPVAGNVLLVERMADDLVPVAILHSAAVLKFFVDEVRSLPGDPEIPVRESDPDAQVRAGGCNASGQGPNPLASLVLFFLLLPITRTATRQNS